MVAVYYHNVAKVIVEAFEKRRNFLTRGFFEIEGMQNDTGARDKFTLSTYTRLADGFIQDFRKFQKNCDVNIRLATGDIQTIPAAVERSYNLMFVPLDSPINFSRSIPQSGACFVVQSISADGASDNMFMLLYDIRTQKYLYSEHNGFAYIENKKARQGKGSASMNSLIALNRKAVSLIGKYDFLTENSRITVSNSIVSDIFLLAGGSVDKIIYMIPSEYEKTMLSILASSLRRSIEILPDCIVLH